MAEDAIELVKSFQKFAKENIGTSRIPENIMVIELDTSKEFNRFSQMLNEVKNAKIQNIQIIGDRYILTVRVLPDT